MKAKKGKAQLMTGAVVIRSRSGEEFLTQGDWVGWLWDLEGRYWRRVCQGGSLAVCSQELSRVVDDHGVHDGLSILTRGPAPIGPPPATTRT
jgi:hypothetical protein